MLRRHATASALAFLLTAPAAAQDGTTVTGIVLPLSQLTVCSRVEGNVARVNVRLGDPVAALATMVVISAPDMHADLGRCDAELHTEEQVLEVVAAAERIARVRLDQTRRTVQRAEQRLPALKALVASAEEQLATVRAAHEAGRATADAVAEANQAVLYQKESQVQFELELQELRDEVAIAEHDQARAAAEVIAQRGRIDMARAAREAQRVRTEMGEVKNILPGARVTRLLVDKGSYVTPGTPLLELMDMARVVVTLEVPAARAARVKAGTAVQLQALAEVPDRAGSVTAQIARVAGALDPDTQTMRVEVDLDNADGRWLPGQQLTAIFPVERPR